MTETTPAAVDVEFELPTEFHPLTLGSSPEEARAELVARIGRRVSDVPAAALDRLAQEYAAASQWLDQAGVCYAATCLGLLDGELTLATLTLARAELDCRDPEVVDRIVEVLGAGDPEKRQAKRYDLPCGPAAVAVGAAVETVLPAAEAGTDEDFPVPIASLEAWVPVPAAADPTRRSAIVLRFSTPSLRHWEAYCPVLVEALRTLRFPAAGGGAPAADPEPAQATSRIAAALG
ncbi:hypothetical protein [Streptacidiphilus anmyonensis]|uniref:hypothetical protein n=1 Tax=Streptacidiphilus anmyonensis TaxID=405782 RepID=UPI0005AA5C4A|nr:hypothetical protein [Streptacidiphilus anmyonensis]